MAKPKILTLARLRQALECDPDTGQFRWLERGHGRRLSGIAGCKKTGKYARIEIQIDKVQYPAHILMWFHMTGEWPDRQIDHIDTNPFNNRWNNLRLATQAQNTQNSGVRRTNGSGLLGAYWDKSQRRWLSSIRGKYLGTFETAEQAHEAYKKAALELYGEFAHHSLKN